MVSRVILPLTSSEKERCSHPNPLQEIGIPAPLVKGKIDPVWKSWKTSSMIYIAKLLDVYLKVLPWYAIFAVLTIIPVEIALQQATGDLKH
jgi:hypothetical protein